MNNLFLPEVFIKKVLPKSFFSKKILENGLKLKQAIKRAILAAAGDAWQDVAKSLADSLDFYEQKTERLEKERVKRAESKAINGEKLIKNRVENTIMWAEAQRLKKEYKGKKYIWLPSSSKEPRPEHQLRYGKIYTVGDGIFPAEDYGCKCGALFLDEDKDV